MNLIFIGLFPLILAQEMTDTSVVQDSLLESYQRYVSGIAYTYEETASLARTLAYSELWEEAVEVYTSLLSEYPDDPDLQLGRGLVYSWQGRYEEAEGDLKRITQEYPEYSEAWMALGNVYLWWGLPENAEQSYSRWVALNPQIAEPYIARAKAFRELRRYGQARQDLKNALLHGGDEQSINEELRQMDRIPAPRPWEPLMTVEQLSFSDERPDWTTLTMLVKREISSGSVAAGYLQTERWDQWDGTFLIDGYVNLWERAYGSLRLHTLSRRRVLPERDLTVEIYQGIGTGWEISGFLREMKFPEKTTWIIGSTLALYASQWYLRGQALIVPEGQKLDWFGMGTVRRYLMTVDDFLEIGVGGGQEVETGLEGPEFFVTRVLTGRAQIFFRQRWGLTFGGSYQQREGVERLGYTLGLITRW